MPQTLQSSFEDLAAQFARAFPPRLASARTVGREAEFPIVDASGAAFDVQSLWADLQQRTPVLKPKYDAVNPELIVGLDGPDFGYALEVGRGTLEIFTRPCAHLLELETIHSDALRRLIQVAHAHGGRVLGLGMQPLTPPSLALMSPKQRYRAMFDSMGEDWLWYTTTASDQLHVDVARPEMTQMLNLSLLMTPVVLALCGNSPLAGGRIGAFCATREGIVTQRSRYADRHGMITHAYADPLDLVTRLSRLPYLLRRQGTHLLPDGRPFEDVLATEGADFDAFLLHDHYIWHSARLRVAHATLELRAACQQPHHEQMSAAAFYLGIVEAAPALQAYVDDRFGAAAWTILRAYHAEAARHGLAEPEPASNFLSTVLKAVENALKTRGYGEKSW
ncbi:MAG: glutamate-cysteine ligase family protein [Caldilineaceae bacterium]